MDELEAELQRANNKVCHTGHLLNQMTIKVPEPWFDLTHYILHSGLVTEYMNKPFFSIEYVTSLYRFYHSNKGKQGGFICVAPLRNGQFYSALQERRSRFPSGLSCVKSECMALACLNWAAPTAQN